MIVIKNRIILLNVHNVENNKVTFSVKNLNGETIVAQNYGNPSGRAAFVILKSTDDQCVKHRCVLVSCDIHYDENSGDIYFDRTELSYEKISRDYMSTLFKKYTNFMPLNEEILKEWIEDLRLNEENSAYLLTGEEAVVDFLGKNINSDQIKKGFLELHFNSPDSRNCYLEGRAAGAACNSAVILNKEGADAILHSRLKESRIKP